MEDFLPLLIGIIWLVYTLYNKGQKQKAKKGLPATEGKSQMSSILEELLLGKVVNPTTPVYADESEVKPFTDFTGDEEPVESFQASIPKPVITSELEKYTIEGEHAFPVEDFIDDFSYSTENILLNNNEFDLKRAVIYSEILNAPYI